MRIAKPLAKAHAAGTSVRDIDEGTPARANG
jgi:hypothetical protein